MSKAQAQPQMEMTEVVKAPDGGPSRVIAVQRDMNPPNDEPPKAEIVPTPPQAVTPMALIEIAVNQNADINKIEKLMELQLRWEANEARKAYVAAMKSAKAEIPEIVKNRTVSFGEGRKTEYTYATLDNICDKVVPVLSRHGITHRWRTEQHDGKIRVTCILTHELGHSEETSLEGMPDTTGSKNAIQAIGSATYYLFRYTFTAAVGIAVKGIDDDSQVQAGMEGLPQILADIKESRTVVELQARYQKAFKEATRLANPQALKAILAAKDERKKELEVGE